MERDKASLRLQARISSHNTMGTRGASEWSVF
jgi:hypothetical protein